MKLSPPAMLVLFVLGAVAALVGDHGHVATGTTEYFTRDIPDLWSSPFWFPVMVGVATVLLAELRLHLPRPRVDVTPRQALAGVAAVVGTYAVTALVHAVPPVPAIALVCALAALIGPVVEIVLAELGVFRYADREERSAADSRLWPWG